MIMIILTMILIIFAGKACLVGQNIFIIASRRTDLCRGTCRLGFCVCCYLYGKDKLFFSTQCNSVYAAKLVFLINDYYYLITCMIRYRLDNTNLLIYFVSHDTFLGILVVLGFGFTCTEKTIWNNQFGYF